MSTREEEQPGRVVGDRYRLSAQLGSGAMGTVWSGFDEVLRRRVAVKELKVPRGIPEREALGMRERMLREARALGGLSHPNVITVFDVVDAEGEPLVVLEMVPSRNLATIITDQGPLSARQAAVVGYATAAALRAAHRAGITHRDVKPGNVLVAHDGRIKLTDFGIARNASDAPMTTAGLVLGSPAYIAPEVAMGSAVTPAADLWGLGATLYAAIEGRPPYDVKGDPVSTITEVVDGDVPRPRDAGPISEVIAALMVKDPDRRMSLDDVRRRLRPLLDDPDDPLYPGSPEAPTSYSMLPLAEPVPEPRVAASGPVERSARMSAEPPVARSQRMPAEPPVARSSARMPAAPPRGLAAAPGPLPQSTYQGPARPPVGSGTAMVPGTPTGPAPAAGPPPRPGLPPRWAVPLAVAGAVLVLLGAAAGFATTRAVAGQPPFSTVSVSTAQSPTTTYTDAARWSVGVPEGWRQFQSGTADGVVRFVSPDGAEELSVWHARAVTDITGALTAARLGVQSVQVDPGPDIRYTTTAGTLNRTTAVRTVPVPDGVWAVALTVPADRAGTRSDALLAALAATFRPPTG